MATSEQISWVAKTLGVDPAAPSSTAKGRNNRPAAGSLARQQARLQKMGQIWALAEAKVRRDAESLRKELMQLYDGDEAAAEMEKEIQVHVDKVFDAFDGRLVKQLAAGAAVKEDSEWVKIKAEIRDTIDGHMEFVSKDVSIAMMDENPLVELKIAEFCRTTLNTMLRAIQ